MEYIRVKKFIIIYFFIALLTDCVLANDYKYILHDSCINALYNPAVICFKNTDISVVRTPQGIILTFELINPEQEFYCLSENMIEKMSKIEYFLAKIKNPVIIEVHIEDPFPNRPYGLKNWEVSTVIANNVEKEFRRSDKNIRDRLHSVGYGEFLPKNTSNNGGKLLNRIDIIILCKISGE